MNMIQTADPETEPHTRHTELLDQIHGALNQLQTGGTEGFTRGEIRDQILAANKLQESLDAALIPIFAAGRKERVFELDRARSDSTWLSTRTRRSRASCANQFSRSYTLIEDLPDLYLALVDGRVNSNHVDAILRVSRRPKLQPFVVRDIHLLIGFAAQHWDQFNLDLEGWAEYVDPVDPADQDEKAHQDRKMIVSQGLGGVTMIQIDMPNLEYEQLTNSMQPHYEAMLEEEWRVAREEYGDDAACSDLERTDAQRWLDALMAGQRAGAGGTDDGASVEVCIVMDLATFEREAARQSGQPAVPLTDKDAEDYRCETLSGRPISPTAALRAATFGSIRRIVLGLPDMRIDASIKKRLFSKKQRQALMIRDRTCTGAGCDTRANKCEADHVLPFTKDGPTSTSNGKMRCKPCHRHKTRLELAGFWDHDLDRPKPMPDVGRRPS